MAAEPARADAKLQACFRQYLEGLFQFRPLEATRLGDHRFDRQLEDLSAAARAAGPATPARPSKSCPGG